MRIEPDLDHDAGDVAPDEVVRCAPPPEPDEAPQACSPASEQARRLRVVNNCDDTAVNVYWLHFDCTEKQYAFLPAGDRFQLSTSEGHVWRVRSAADGAWIRDFAIDDDADAIHVTCLCEGDP